MRKYEKQRFADQSIVIDGNHYVACEFVRCRIQFSGGSLPKLIDNSFTDCSFVFDGAAARTVQFMTALYGGGGKDLIETTFESIRGKPAGGLRLQ
jgi:hypothetical protein